MLSNTDWWIKLWKPIISAPLSQITQKSHIRLLSKPIYIRKHATRNLRWGSSFTNLINLRILNDKSSWVKVWPAFPKPHDAKDSVHWYLKNCPLHWIRIIRPLRWKGSIKIADINFLSLRATWFRQAKCAFHRHTVLHFKANRWNIPKSRIQYK